MSTGHNSTYPVLAGLSTHCAAEGRLCVFVGSLGSPVHVAARKLALQDL